MVAWISTYPKLGTILDISTEFLVKTDIDSTAYFVIIPQGSLAPSVQQVKDGKDSTGAIVSAGHSGSAALTANVENLLTAINLIALTAYDVYFVAESEGVSQDATVMLTFTTVDITAPSWVLTYPKLGTVGLSTTEILSKINENGIAYFVVLPRYSTVPSSTQVSLGVDANNLPVSSGFAGSVILTTNVENTINASNLSANTDYDVYVVAMDEHGILQSAPVKIVLTTKMVIVRQHGILRRFIGSYIDITMSSVEVATSKDISILTIAAFAGDNYEIIEQDGMTITIKLIGDPNISTRDIKIKVGDNIVVSDEFLYKVSIIDPQQNLKSKPVSYGLSTPVPSPFRNI